MRQSALPQRTRLIDLLIEIAVLLRELDRVRKTVTSEWNQEAWFCTGIARPRVFGSRLNTPSFASMADVIIYAAPAVVALALSNNWTAGIGVEFIERRSETLAEGPNQIGSRRDGRTRH